MGPDTGFVNERTTVVLARMTSQKPARPVKLVKITALLWLFLLLLASSALGDERILRMDVSAQVRPDATVAVRERLKVQVENIEISRGIIREFPTDYTDSGGRAWSTRFNLVEATIDGRRAPAQVERVGRNVEIRIGDPNQILSKGVHTFELAYSTLGWIAFHRDSDELFWNVTGTWGWPIDVASFRLSLPGDASPTRVAAYTGRYGDRGQDVESISGGGLSTTRTLAPGEGFSVAFGWQKGLVTQPPEDALTRGQNFFLRYRLPITILFVLIVLTYYFSVWYVVGKDPTKGTVIPIWRPPAGIEPGFARYLRKMKFAQEVLVADIIELAVRGFVRFTKNDKGDTAIVPTEKSAQKEGEAGLTESLHALFTTLFVGAGKSGVSVTQNNGDVFYRAAQRLELEYVHRAKQYYSKNTLYSLFGLLLFVPMLALVFSMSDGWDSLMDIAGPFSLLIAAIINTFAKRKWLLPLSLIVLFPIGTLFSLDRVVLGGMSLAAAIAFGFSLIMPARTAKGAQVLAEIEGLVMYMGTAERQRLSILNPPNETPELFERLFPYAYALDCAETWANSFEKILKQASFKPEWDGISPGNTFLWNTFSMRTKGGFVRNLNSSVANYRSTQVKQVSSYRGGSGFGGGGGVGRGGGGGGGRGW